MDYPIDTPIDASMRPQSCDCGVVNGSRQFADKTIRFNEAAVVRLRSAARRGPIEAAAVCFNEAAVVRLRSGPERGRELLQRSDASMRPQSCDCGVPHLPPGPAHGRRASMRPQSCDCGVGLRPHSNLDARLASMRPQSCDCGVHDRANDPNPPHTASMRPQSCDCGVSVSMEEGGDLSKLQ